MERPQWPRLERRLSGVRDRRLTHRGGRRVQDLFSSLPSPDIRCVLCRIGLATIYAIAYESGERVTTYRCAICGYMQYRFASK
jgi:hypothetical protein